ncbi:MAG: hypothetical protein GY935_26165 [Gammaproteobacteria bacterium]|nr:hypothetical protein [Gammaproteobacteria bacterium]
MPTIMQAIGEDYPIKVIGNPVYYQPLAVAMDIGDDTVAARLKDIIGWMHNDGTFSKISKSGSVLTMLQPTSSGSAVTAVGYLAGLSHATAKVSSHVTSR